MPSRNKLIVVMIDGVSADMMAAHPECFPAINELGRRGGRVRRLRPSFPATSLPGRASMLTGAKPPQHGIWGNHVFDGSSFRVATPSDVQTPTLARQMKQCGLVVANIGLALVHPDDTDIFRPPWWLRGFIEGSRFSKGPTGDLRKFTDEIKDSGNALVTIDGLLAPLTAEPNDERGALMACVINDTENMRIATALACSDNGPDLILTEILMTDVIQHVLGYESASALWAFRQADRLVGDLVQALEHAGRRDEYALLLASDHGHGPVEAALHPDVILDREVWECEGATLHVFNNGKGTADCRRRLEAHGALQVESAHLPEAMRDQIATFVAPAGRSFEPSSKDSIDTAIGQPCYVSTHGFAPGSKNDDRFLVWWRNGQAKSELIEAAEPEFFHELALTLCGIDLKGQ